MTMSAGAVVLLSLAAVAYEVFVPPIHPPVRTLHMICTKCGVEFARSEADLPLGRLTKAMGYRDDCPRCGGQLSAREAIQCPSCGKWFVPPENGREDHCPACAPHADHPAMQPQ